MSEITAETLEKALVFAINAHKGQVRKGNGRPYILHPISVMSRIFANKESKNMYMLACAAALNDCIEDADDIKLDDIRREFGDNIADIVDELTSDKEKCKLIGKKEYLLQKLNMMSSYALAIKLCDRLDNICDMKDMDDAFKHRYVLETNYILDNLDRHLSKTHINLIEQIKTELRTYEKK